MAFTEVGARLGLDIKPFEQGLARSATALGSFKNRALKNLDLKDAGRSAAIALGLSVDKLAAKLVEPFQKAAELAKDIAESSERTLANYQDIFRGRRTDEQNLDVNRKEQARLQRELAGIGEQRGTISEFNPFTQKFEDRNVVTRQDDPRRRQEIAEELSRLAKEEEALTTKLNDKKDKLANEDGARFADRFKDEKELQSLKDKNARATMSAEQEIATLAERQQMLKFKESMGSASADELKEIETIEGEIVELKKKQREEAEKADKAAKDASDKSIRAAERLRDVTRDAAEAWMDLQRDKSDRTGFTLEEVARGEDGVSQTSKVRAKRILDLEKRAKRQRAQGFDSASEATMNEAAKLREGFGLLNSSERNPLRTQENAVIEGIRGIDDAKKTGGQIDIAAKQLRSAADELKIAATTVNSAFRSVPVP